MITTASSRLGNFVQSLLVCAGTGVVACALAGPLIAANPILQVTRSGSGTGTVISNIGLINCGATCSDAYAPGTQVALTAVPTMGNQFTGWLGPCIGIGQCVVTVNASTVATATFAPTATGFPAFDIDGTGSYDALTDGVLVIRYLLGLNGTALTNGAIGPAASRATGLQVAGYLNDIRPALDIDGDGQADAVTDGVLLARYLFGFRGSSLIAGAVGAGATRNSANLIETEIEFRTGSCLDGGAPRALVRPLVGDLVITEVMPRPLATASSNGQWFEVAVNRAVDLNGVRIERTGGVASTLIASTSCLRATAGSLLLFARSADAASNGGLPYVTGTFNFSLLSGGASGAGEIRLVSNTALLDGFVWTQSTSGKSLQLDPGFVNPAANDFESNWCNATGVYGVGDLGTPGFANAQCVPTLPPGMCVDNGNQRAIVKAPVGALVITEYLANPAGTSDAQREWFEIVNASASMFDLNGLELARTGLAGDVINSTSCKPVAPGGFALFARSAESSLNGGLPPVDAVFTFPLTDGSGTIEVRDGATLLDRVSWLTPVTSGKSTQLNPNFFTALGNDISTNWCLSTAPYGDGTNLGSPKSANFVCP